MSTGKPRPDTIAVHGAGDRTNPWGAIVTPIAQTSTFRFDSTQQLLDHIAGTAKREEYGRYTNPTVRSAERRIADLEGAEDAILFGSGMAALSTTMLALLKSGQHIVVDRDMYRPTRQFAASTLLRWGIEGTVVDFSEPAAVAAAVRPRLTRMALLEVPSNPHLRSADLRGLKEALAPHRGLQLVVDATLATPMNLRPIELGADLVIHSATKFLGGHNDLLAGAVAGRASVIEAIRDLRGQLGGVLDPHAAWLLERGLRTLPVRMERHNRSAQRIAEFLAGHPEVERVFYPGLPSHPDHATAVRQMGGGFGGLVSFLARGDMARCSRVVDAGRLIQLAASLGGVESLWHQPPIFSWHDASPEERAANGVEENLVRLSVGLEDPEDLIADLERALATP